MVLNSGKTNSVLALFLVLVCFSAYSQDKELLSRKVEKQIQKIYGKEITAQVKDLGEDPENIIPNYNLGDQVFLLEKNGATEGYLLTTRALGRFDFFDYAVIFTPDLKVKDVMITEYRSSHGYGIINRKWLSQFIDYKGTDLIYGKDIDAISGSTISAKSLTGDLQRCFLLMDGLFN